MSGAPATIASEPPAPLLGARELLLRAALGAVLALLPTLAFVLTQASARREWHYFVAIGLFLGGLAGLAGLAERLGAGRRAWAQVGIALALAALTTGWGLAAVLQAEWTKTALTSGPDAANAEVMRFMSQALRAGDQVLQMFLPLGVAVAAQTLVRTRRGGWFAHLAAVALPLALGGLCTERTKVRHFVLIFGAGLAAMSAASAWAAGALSRRWWPTLEADPAPPGPGAT